MQSNLSVDLDEVAKILSETLGDNRVTKEHFNGLETAEMGDAGFHRYDVVRVRIETEDQVAEVLKAASAYQWRVLPVGAGSQLHATHLGAGVDILLDLTSLNQIIDYSPEDMVVSVQAGVTLTNLQELLSTHKQMLPLDPVCRPGATLGGLIATAANGPRRTGYGTFRDVVAGVRVVYPSGDIMNFGGRVMKNVAGYDMTKLFIGSFGTLAVIVEAHLKLKPLPLHRETVTMQGRREDLKILQKRLVHSSLLPTRLEAVSSRVFQNGILSRSQIHHPWLLAIDCDENASAAAYQTSQLRTWADEMGLSIDVFQGVSADDLWTHYQESLLGFDFVLRLNIAPTLLWQIVTPLEKILGEAEGEGVFSLGMTTGVGRLYGKGLSFKVQEELVQQARGLVSEYAGSVVIEKAEPWLQEKVDVFGSIGDFQPWLQRIKDAIDPQNILSPGRFVGGMKNA